MLGLSYFVATVEAGSFAGAAARLGLTQPAVSRQVRLLERELGMSLLVSVGPRRLGPTASGEVLLAGARELATSLEELKRDALAHAVEPTGPLCVAVPPAIGATLLQAVMPEYLSRYPRVRVGILTGYSGYVEGWLRSGDADIGFLWGEPQGGDVETQPLFELDMFLIAPTAGLRRGPSVQNWGIMHLTAQSLRVLHTVPPTLSPVVETEDGGTARLPQCWVLPRRRDVTAVNLDALIVREDFEIVGAGDEIPEKPSIGIRELERGEFFSAGLRKPDFQRETSEWEPRRVVGLIRSFVQDQLIPSVILWKNKDLLFVIDGSHRLSALIAWVQDDYGHGAKSQEFFGPSIQEDQLKIAEKTRELVAKEVGSYADHRAAVSKPELYSPEISAQAKRLSTLTLKLQWVRGDASKAEDSFARINQQAATITPQELELIRDRRKPTAIAARAIIHRGSGHQYWQKFSSSKQEDIKELASDLHRLIFEPTLRYPIKSLNLPLGGATSAATALRMVYDLIGLSVDMTDRHDDTDGSRTISHLIRMRRIVRMMLSNDPSSLGLHPAVYFYSWTGKQIPSMLLSTTTLLIEIERRGKLTDFIDCRHEFENFLVVNRSLQNQIVRKYGSSTSGRKHLLDFYKDVLRLLDAGVPSSEIVGKLQAGNHSYLQPEESPYEGVAPTRFSTQVKSGVIVQELLKSAPRCPICQGFLPAQAMSIDHRERKEDGGLSIDGNAQLTHPYCNTGYKEAKLAKRRKMERELL